MHLLSVSKKDAPPKSDPTFLEEPDSSPEIVLLCVILEQAIRDLVSLTESPTRSRVRVNQVKRWFNSDSNREWGFHWICDNLSLEPVFLRKKLSAFLGRSSIDRTPRRDSRLSYRILGKRLR